MYNDFGLPYLNLGVDYAHHNTSPPPLQDFGRLVNSIATRGLYLGYYAQHITGCPPRIFRPSYGPTPFLFLQYIFFLYFVSLTSKTNPEF